ncbi:hypothetical protein quinque_007314 [Culex quinquefasciatus]
MWWVQPASVALGAPGDNPGVKLVRRENQVVVSWVVDTSLDIIELLAELGIDKAEKAERTVTMIREVFRKHFQVRISDKS